MKLQQCSFFGGDDVKNIMFDLYGTLIDIHTDEEKPIFWTKLNKKYKYSNDYKNLKKDYLDECKLLELDREEIEILEVFKKIFPNYSPNDVAMYFRKQSTEYIKLYKGVKKLLKDLKGLGYNLYILSNAQASFTIPELKKLKLFKCFDQIAISSDYGVKKPNKEFYINAMNKFNIISNDTIMIGNDYECDIAPAKELGIRTIFIKSNLTPKDQLQSYDLNGFDYKKIIEIIEDEK